MSYSLHTAVFPGRTITIPAEVDLTIVSSEGPLVQIHALPGVPAEIPSYRLLQIFPEGADDASLERILAALSDVPALGLDLGCARKVTDEGLSSVRLVPWLAWLHLLEREDLTDRALEHIAGHEGIIELDLDTATQITDLGLAHVGTLRNLQGLNLRGCSRVTAAGVAHLARLPLRELDLGFCNLGDEIAETLDSIKTLATLRPPKGLSPEIVARVSSQTTGADVTIDAPLDADSMASLASLASPRALSLRVDPRVVDLSALQKHTSLERLTLLLPADLDRPSLSALGPLPNLHEICLEGGVDDEDLAWIGGRQTLEHITFSRCDRLTGEGLSALAALSRAKWLTFWRCASLPSAPVEALRAQMPWATVDR